VPAITEAVHSTTNRVSTLLVNTRDTPVAAVGAVGTSLRDQVAELRSTMVSQHRRRLEALLGDRFALLPALGRDCCSDH
jgi:hypothetical protein